MTLENWITFLSAAAALVSAVMATLSRLSAERAAERAGLAERTRVFVDLRERWYAIRRELKRQTLDGTELPDTKDEEWDVLELYWQHVFTEWYTTTQLHSELAPLWHDYFAHVVGKSLKQHLPLRYVAWCLVEKRWSAFGTCSEEFRETLEELNGGPLNAGKNFLLPETGS